MEQGERDGLSDGSKQAQRQASRWASGQTCRQANAGGARACGAARPSAAVLPILTATPSA